MRPDLRVRKGFGMRGGFCHASMRERKKRPEKGMWTEGFEVVGGDCDMSMMAM